jgi:hypothetical protein
MTFFRFASIAIASIVSVTDAASHAGTVIVSGDVTPVFSLTSSSPDPATSGNRRFFTNILGGGTSVVIRNTSFNSFAAPEIDEFYDSLPGVVSTLVAGPVTGSQLASADLFLAPVPNTAFSASEGIAIASFLNSGGGVVLMGESEGIEFGPETNGYVNGLLTYLGSQLTLVTHSLDIGPQIATGSRIANHPLTAEVTAYNYGSASIVEGGVPLYFSHGGAPFVAVETLTVPEPGGAALLAIGLAMWALRRAGARGVSP